METGQYAGCMIIVEQLASEFQIQLASEFRDTLLDLLRLQTEVFVIVKTYLVHCRHLSLRIFATKIP